MSLRPPVSDKDHIQGNSSAVIELVEYGDFQCPYCGRAYPIIKGLQQTFGKDLRFVFRNFPLSKIHPQAKRASIAAEAACQQDKFWEMHDIIFENQRHLTASALIQYATNIGLNVGQFKNDLNNETLKEKVESDFFSGLRSGVNGTPGLFVNGEKYNESWEEAPFTLFLQKKLNLPV
jgi:protein-disulfide isomerase